MSHVHGGDPSGLNGAPPGAINSHSYDGDAPSLVGAYPFLDDNAIAAEVYHFGGAGLGVLGSQVPSTGNDGPGYLYNDLELPGDLNKEVRGLVVVPPQSGTFFPFEDSSWTLSGVSDGLYSFQYRLYVDGTDLGLADATIVIGVVEQVVADFAASYSVVGFVQADFVAQYAVRGSVSADFVGTYQVGVAGLTPVQRDFAAAYVVRGSAEASFAAAYIVMGSVEASFAAAYTVGHRVVVAIKGAGDVGDVVDLGPVYMTPSGRLVVWL